MNQYAAQCPVDGLKVNETQVRIVAFLVLLLITTYGLTGHWYLLVILLGDFALRAFGFGKFSPLAWLSQQLVRLLGLSGRFVDQAPKRFAAKIGLIFSTVILLFHGLGWSPIILVSLLAIFACLEAMAGFCAGCQVYAFLQLLKTKRQQVRG